MRTGTSFFIAVTLWLLISAIAWADPDDDFRDDEQGQTYQLPEGLWIGRRPSPDELQAIVSQLRSRKAPAATPAYEIGDLRLYLGSPLGEIESLRRAIHR